MEGNSILDSGQAKIHSLAALLDSDLKILGLARPETLVQLNLPSLNRIFSSDRLMLPEFDSSNCVARQLKQWCEINQPDVILAVGGDGTLNLASQAAIENQLRLVLVPAGTANDFARGLPDSTPQQFSWTVADLIELKSEQHSGNSGFINMLAAGCGARHSTDVDSETKAAWGSLAYLVQAWQVLGDLEGFGLKMTCDAREYQFAEVVQVFVANGRTCGGGYCVVDTARFDDGLMDVVVIQQGTALQIASFIQSYMLGNHLEHELCRHIRCQQAELNFDQVEAMTLDGEPSEMQRAELSVLPVRLPISKLDPISWGDPFPATQR